MVFDAMPDVVHPPLPWDDVRRVLQGWSMARWRQQWGDEERAEKSKKIVGEQNLKNFLVNASQTIMSVTSKNVRCMEVGSLF